MNGVALTAAAFERLAAVAKAEAGLLLPEVKREMVQSRLARRLRALRLASYEAYCDVIEAQSNKGERRELIHALTTNVTRFMREPHHFDEFAAVVAPTLISDARRGDRVRIWSAGCSTGEEPYSIAITMERAAGAALERDAKILATDIDDRVLKAARRGRYPLSDAKTAFKDDAARYFERDGEEAVVSATIRSLVSFKHLNLIEEWPMKGPFQAIFCRNTLIYFDAETQFEVIRRFADLLRPGGSLFLGHSERVAPELEAKFERSGLTSYRRL